MSEANKISVAIVDDDASLCNAMERLLRAAGFQSSAYPSAEAFLADRRRERLDCILLDIQLGGMSGFELQSYLAASGSTVPESASRSAGMSLVRSSRARALRVARMRP